MKWLYVILKKKKKSSSSTIIYTHTYVRWRCVVIADLLALEQRLLKAVSPNTFLLDTLG